MIPRQIRGRRWRNDYPWPSLIDQSGGRRLHLWVDRRVEQGVDRWIERRIEHGVDRWVERRIKRWVERWSSCQRRVACLARRKDPGRRASSTAPRRKAPVWIRVGFHRLPILWNSRHRTTFRSSIHHRIAPFHSSSSIQSQI